MKATVNFWLVAVALGILAAFPAAAPAQFWKNTPVDPNTWKDVDPTNKNSSVSKALDSARGGRYEVTLRNPTKNPIFYQINGQEQVGLPAGYKVTLRGVGTAQIKFDIGAGDGTYRSYNLRSGRSYYFDYRNSPAVGASSGGSFLDLFEGIGPQQQAKTSPQSSGPSGKVLGQSVPGVPTGPSRVKRTVWAYSGGFFEHEGDGRWVEKNASATHRFTETRRTAGYVELFDGSRNYTVRLSDSAAYIKGGKVKKFSDFTQFQTGRWTR